MKIERTIFFSLLSLAVLGPAVQAGAEEINGIAEVRSGSELVLGDTIVRLYGLEAPATDDKCDLIEGRYHCGIVAWAELIKLADGRALSCDIESRTDDGLPAVTCYLGERDINEALVRSGWAEAQGDVARYEVEQAEARRARRGLWAERIRPPDRRQAP